MESILTCFKALADETRLRILYILWLHEFNVNELVSILQMGQSRVSRHLKILAEAGLAVARREGLWFFYSVPKDGPNHKLLAALIPFLEGEDLYTNDKLLAQAMINERSIHNQDFFKHIAEDWDNMTEEFFGSLHLGELIYKHMPTVDVAVDLGCATGSVLEAMRPKAKQLIGVDGSARMLELARRRFIDSLDTVSLRIGDLLHLPLKDREANFVCLNFVLHHVQSPLDTLQEVHRVLAKGGTFILTDFDLHDNEDMRTNYKDRWLGFDVATLLSFLTAAGFLLQERKYFPLEKNMGLHFIVTKVK